MSSKALESPATVTVSSPIGIALAVVTVALVSWQYVIVPWSASGTAEHAAVHDAIWVFLLYVGACTTAALLVPSAVSRAIGAGEPTPAFSVACFIAAAAGVAMYVMVGDTGVGAGTMGFYWGGLAALWSGSILMIHLCRRIGKRLALRDWTIYASAMTLIPLTLIPSLPLWPLLFELDPGQTLMTAATSAFAAHMLIAHYVIFEILERRPRRR